MVLFGASDALLQALSLALMPMIARTLGSSALGVWSTSLSLLAALSTVASLGVGASAGRVWLDIAPERRAGMIAALYVVLGAVIVGVGALGLGIAVAADTTGRLGPWTLTSVALVLAAAVGLQAQVLPRAIWATEEAAARIVAVNLVTTGLFVLTAAVGVGLLSQPVDWLFVSRASAALLGAVATLGFAAWALRDRPDWAAAREALHLGWPTIPHQLAHWGLAVADRFVIGRWLGFAAVGQYSVAYVCVDVFALGMQAMNRAISPQLARWHNEPAHRAYLVDLIDAFVRVSFGALVLSNAWAPHLVVWTFGSGYDEASRLAPVLLLGAGPWCLYFSEVNALFYQRRVRSVPVGTVTSAILGVGATIGLVQLSGLLGAALGTVFGYAVLWVFTRWRASLAPRVTMSVRASVWALASWATAALLAVWVWFEGPVPWWALVLVTPVGVGLSWRGLRLLLRAKAAR
jgi:O-antigen/teichoic acid export membrane protein